MTRISTVEGELSVAKFLVGYFSEPLLVAACGCTVLVSCTSRYSTTSYCWLLVALATREGEEDEAGKKMRLGRG